jgi:hypothetical protein
MSEINVALDLAWRMQEARVPQLPLAVTRVAAVDVSRIHYGLDDGIDPILLRNRLIYEPACPPQVEPSPPRASLISGAGEALQHPHLRHVRLAAIGAGAGAIMVSAYLTRRGMQADHIQFVDPSGRNAGIWGKAWVQEGGFNNPTPLEFSLGELLIPEDRSGSHMFSFLDSIAQNHLGTSPFINETATDIAYNEDGNLLVATDSGTEIAADYVILATGTPHPRRIDGVRLRSNLDSIPPDSLMVERYQRTLTPEELRSGRHIVLIGLGNSTAAMLRQIKAHEQKHHTVVPLTVFTDAPDEAIQNPTLALPGRKSVFRQPVAQHYTGYSGDLPEDLSCYNWAVQRGAIVGDVDGVHFDLTSRDLIITRRDGSVTPVIHDPHIFALLGYERDTHLFKQLGVTAKVPVAMSAPGIYIPDIRASDGAVRTDSRGYLSNVFAVGAVAATQKSPNAGIIPGIMAQTLQTALTIIVRSYGESLNRSSGTRFGHVARQIIGRTDPV